MKNNLKQLGSCIKNSLMLTNKKAFIFLLLLTFISIQFAVAINPPSGGTGVVTITAGTKCFKSTAANGAGPDNWELAQGGHYTMVITNVTECSGTAITVFCQNSNTGNFCFTATATGTPGQYSGEFDMPNPACFTTPVSYKCGANAACNNANTYNAAGPFGATTVHLRASNFNINCVKTSTDENCTGSTPCLIALSETHTNVNCFNNSNGTISISQTGGVGNISYLWNDGNTNEDRTGLAAGIYTVSASDANGCTTSLSITISQPSASLDVNITGQSNPTCAGSNGSINILAIGGTAAYSFLWNNGSTIANVNNLSAGVYTVTVSDINGCSKQVSITLTTTVLTAKIFKEAKISCNGVCDAILKVNTPSGTAPFSFLWSNGQTTRRITNLCPGTYSVTVSDASGCNPINLTNILVLDKKPLQLDQVKTEITAPGANDGTVTWTTTGGTSPYTFIWSDGYTLSNRTNIGPGTYTITITDANGCSKTIVKKWKNPAPRFGTELTNYNLSVFPNPSTGLFNVEIDALISELYTVNVIDLQGRIVMTQNFDAEKGLQQFNIDMSGQPKGIYMLTVSNKDSKSIQKLIIE